MTWRPTKRFRGVSQTGASKRLDLSTLGNPARSFREHSRRSLQKSAQQRIRGTRRFTTVTRTRRTRWQSTDFTMSARPLTDPCPPLPEATTAPPTWSIRQTTVDSVIRSAMFLARTRQPGKASQMIKQCRADHLKTASSRPDSVSLKLRASPDFRQWPALLNGREKKLQSRTLCRHRTTSPMWRPCSRLQQ